jgi:hypothetical protein
MEELPHLGPALGPLLGVAAEIPRAELSRSAAQANGPSRSSPISRPRPPTRAYATGQRHPGRSQVGVGADSGLPTRLLVCSSNA